jgi:pyruvate dehydrogenase E1 component
MPMLPFYVFYSMFGFQRIGDLAWQAGDSRSRGFLIGATAGRTTLAGEGLQHQDGSSQLVAHTIPNCVAYDPCFGYELGVIVQDGMRRMLEAQEDVFYYVTVANENYTQPAMPAGAEEGIRRGMYRVRESGPAADSTPSAPRAGVPADRKALPARAQLLGSGPILREALAAAEMLARDWDVAADVWSVTSFSELRRDGMAASHFNRANPAAARRVSWVERCLGAAAGPVIAASDWVSAVADLIRPWVPGRYVALGTDGYGRSDTREALRRYFEVDAKSIVVATLAALAEDGALDRSAVARASTGYGFDPARRCPWEG